MASTSAEIEQLTSGASNRIIPILKTLRKCFIFVLSLFLSLLLLLRPRRRVLPLPSPEEEASPAAPSRRWRRKMAWKLEEEDTARRRSLAEGVEIGEIDSRWSSFLFYGRRGNALFSRSWLPLSGELRYKPFEPLACFACTFRFQNSPWDLEFLYVYVSGGF